jgi:hypothetical protein
MKSSRTARFVAALAFTCLPSASMAATATFDVNGNYSTISGEETFSGTLTVSLIPSPSVVAADITTLLGASTLEFTEVLFQQIGTIGNYDLDLLSLSGPFELQLDITNAADLFGGINGSTIASDSQLTFEATSPIGTDFSGSLDIVPLPAAFPLFATGLGAMGLFGWRTKRKNAAALAAA